METTREKSSQSPKRASDQLTKKTIQRHEDVDSDNDSDSYFFLNRTLPDTIPQHSTNNI